MHNDDYRLKATYKPTWYSGPIRVMRQTKGGMYLCFNPEGIQMQIAKSAMKPNVCDCECHQNPGIMHMMACCSLCYIQEDSDVQPLIDQDIKQFSEIVEHIQNDKS